MNTSTLLERWRRQARLPGGRRLFSLALARVVPFAMRLKPMVLELGAGHARVRIADRRAVHDHLGRIAPGALATLGEFTALLAASAGLEEGRVAHATGMELELLGHGGGPVTADCRLDSHLPGQASVSLQDEAGVRVAEVRVAWSSEAVGMAAGSSSSAADLLSAGGLPQGRAASDGVGQAGRAQ